MLSTANLAVISMSGQKGDWPMSSINAGNKHKQVSINDGIVIYKYNTGVFQDQKNKKHFKQLTFDDFKTITFKRCFMIFFGGVVIGFWCSPLIKGLI